MEKFFAKIKFYLSFLLIFPFFFYQKRVSFIEDKIELLNIYQKKFVQLVKIKHERVFDLYKIKPEIFSKYSTSYTNDLRKTKINKNNFVIVNRELNNIYEAFKNNKEFLKLKNNQINNLKTVFDEMQINKQSYYSKLGMVNSMYNVFVWKNLLKIYEFNKYNINL